VPWNPKLARSATLQVCAALLRRPDDVEQEVLLLASAVLFNPEAFVSESNYRKFLTTMLGWDKSHTDSFLSQMSQKPPDTDTHG